MVGAFEIYLPFAPTAAAIAADTHRVQLVLAVGLLALYLASFRLVAGASRTLRRQAAENLHLALHDTLTQLPNRTLFQDRVQQALLYADRHDVGITVLLIDLDRFKEVNDTLGHQHGDELLAQIAGGSTGRLRECRHRGPPRRRRVRRAAARRRRTAEPRPRRPACSRELHRPASILGDGLGSTSRPASASPSARCTATTADDAVAARRRGDVHRQGNARPASRSTTRPSTTTAGAARARSASCGEALDGGQLIAALPAEGRPATAPGDRRRGAGALGPPRRAGASLPARFIPIAENTGLINPLTVHVLDLALAAGPQLAGDEGRDIPVAVNLSPAACRPDTARRASPPARCRTGCRPALELELTESAVHGATRTGRWRCSPAARAGRAAVDRRLRHRLLVDGLPDAAAGRRAEGRPVVRPNMLTDDNDAIDRALRASTSPATSD